MKLYVGASNAFLWIHLGIPDSARVSFPSKERMLEEPGTCIITCRCASVLERAVAGIWEQLRADIARGAALEMQHGP